MRLRLFHELAQALVCKNFDQGGGSQGLILIGAVQGLEDDGGLALGNVADQNVSATARDEYLRAFFRRENGRSDQDTDEQENYRQKDAKSHFSDVFLISLELDI